MGQEGVQRRVNREEAFAWWYNGGDRLTLAEVADHFEVSKRSVETWSSEGDWLVRAGDIDRQAAEKANRKLATDAARRLNLQRAAGELVIAKVIEGVRSGAIVVTPGDALSWAKHVTILDGGVTERSEQTTPERNAAREAILASIADEVLDLPADAVDAEAEALDADE